MSATRSEPAMNPEQQPDQHSAQPPSPDAPGYPEQPDLPKRAVSGVAWVGVERWTSRALTLVVFAILGRTLDPAAFGVAAIATAVATILSVFVEYGFAQALIQRRILRDEDTSTAFWTSAASGVVLYGLMLLATPLCVHLYDEPELWWVLPVAGLVLPIAGLASTPAALLERNLEFRPLTVRQLTGALVGAAAAVLLALLGAGLVALVLQPVITALVGTIVLWVLARWRPRRMFSTESLRSMWAMSLQVVLIEFLNAMQSNIDKFIVGIFFDPTVLGYYFIGQRVLTILMEVVAAVVGKVSLPTLSRVQDDPPRFRSYFYTLTFVSAAIAFPAFGLVVAFGYPLTDLLFGPGWQESVPLMVLLAPSAMLASVTFFDRSALLARGRGGTSLAVAAGQFAFGTIVLLACVPFGIYAVALGRSLRQIAYWPVRILALHRRAGIQVGRYLAQFAAPTVATAGLVAAGVGLQYTGWAAVDHEVIAFLVPAMMVCAALYVVLLWLTARRRTTGLVRSLRQLARR